jgi:predicted amidohydrolase
MARYINIAAIHFQVNEHRTDPPDAALKQFAEAAERLDGTGVDLVITCEGMESIGQTVDDAEQLDRPGPFLETYRKFAEANHCCVAGSAKIEDAGKVHNALVFFGPDGGILGDYRKTFLTEGEVARGMSPGTGAQVIESPAGRLGGIICFDLNFDELKAAYQGLRPDILCFSSMYNGGHVRATWAYDCRCFLAAACKDNSSQIVDPVGSIVAEANYFTRIARARVNLDRFVMHQDRNMARFPDIYRKYPHEAIIDQRSELGVAVLYSLSADRSAEQIAAEFELTRLDDYFTESRAAQRQFSRGRGQVGPKKKHPA